MVLLWWSPSLNIFTYWMSSVEFGGQLLFKHHQDVPWLGLYQVCSNGHTLMVNFGFFMNFFVHIFEKLLQITESSSTIALNCKEVLSHARPISSTDGAAIKKKKDFF